MNIGVWAYLDNNIGDDLMIKLLVESFSDHTFYLYSEKTVIKNTFTKFNNVVVRDTTEIESDIKSIDAFISIGGSIFNDLNSKRGQLKRLNRIRFIKRLKKKNIKIATIGCNLGPYNNSIGPFLTKLELKMKDLVTVRDQESYELIKKFKCVNNFHLADDIVYNLYKENHDDIKTTGLGITVYRSLRAEENNYLNYKSLAKITDEFISKTNKNVKLFAFDSETENDLSAAHHIFDMSSNQHKIEIIPYLGDMDSFINKMSECERFIAIRFHGAIIADILQIPFLPVVYSNKMSAFLKDRGYTGKTIKIENLNTEYLDTKEITNVIIDEKQLYSREVNLTTNANRHFEELSKLLNKR